MIDCRYRALHAVDEEATQYGAYSIDAATRQDPIYNVCTPFLDVQDQAGRHCQDPRRSEPTSHTNVSAGEDHASRRQDAPQDDAPVLNESELSVSSVSTETRDYGPENGLVRPSSDQPAQYLSPAWMDFYLRPHFLVSLSMFLFLTIAVLELLHYISQHNQGLVTVSENMHYVWNYGPTFGNLNLTHRARLIVTQFADWVYSLHHGCGTVGPAGAACQADNALVPNEPR